MRDAERREVSDTGNQDMPAGAEEEEGDVVEFCIAESPDCFLPPAGHRAFLRRAASLQNASLVIDSHAYATTPDRE